MALVNVSGAGLWIPALPGGPTSPTIAASDVALLDADEEEFQIIGAVHIDGGGSKTFGTSGSSLTWLPGASITFGATATLTVGVKKSTSIDTANGPPARATIGAAAFDVSKALVGGTDTITSLTARTDAMSAGTPFTVADGDLIAICFHLDITANAQSIKVRGAAASTATSFPVNTLVTAGPAYAAQLLHPNVVITFDDGTLGWVEWTIPFSVADAASSTIGNAGVLGNVFQVPYTCKVDALAAVVNPSTSAANFAIELYSTPLGTPGLIESLAVDANAIGAAAVNRLYFRPLATPRTLTINTDYLVGVQQTTATAVTTIQRDILVASHFKPGNMGAECYGAILTGGTFAAQISGKRRFSMYVRVSALDNGAPGIRLAGHGGLAA